MSVSLRAWRICAWNELTDPGARGFEVGEGEWPYPGFVVRRGGQLAAYANICPHKGLPLNYCRDDFLLPHGSLIRCAAHGALFVPESGLCVAGPCAGRWLEPLQASILEGQVYVRAPASRRTAPSPISPPARPED